MSTYSPTVHVLFENPDWMPPLRDALAARGLTWQEHFCEGGTVDLGSVPADGVWVNRMSPSSHTRGHQGGVRFVRELLDWLEASGRPVINGSRAFALEVSKIKQHAALEAMGIRTPRTLGVIAAREGDLSGLSAAARKLPVPFITKHNQGGKGLGVQLFRSHQGLDDFLASGQWESSPDGVDLVQQYIAPAEPFITRVEIVDGRFLYAIRSSTEQGFELCPADACQVGDAFCPAPNSAEHAAAANGEAAAPVDDGRFRLRPEITADDPLVRDLVEFTRVNQLDVAGIEFVEDEQGHRWVYDVNGTSNYNAAVEAAHGLHGMGAIADLCARRLRRRMRWSA